MKQIKLALATCALVLGIFATFAFKPAENTTTAQAGTVYEWFDANTLLWIESETIADAESDCPGGLDPCRVAYTAKTSEDKPAGSYITTLNNDPE